MIEHLMGFNQTVEIKVNGVTLKRDYMSYVVIDERGIKIEEGDYNKCLNRFQDYTGFRLTNAVTVQSLIEMNPRSAVKAFVEGIANNTVRNVPECARAILAKGWV